MELNIQAYELANTIRKSQPPDDKATLPGKKEKYYHNLVEIPSETQKALATILNLSQPVWKLLQANKFEANSFRHISFTTFDDGVNTFTSPENVDGIDVCFVDPNNVSTKLGSVQRIMGKPEYATVIAYTSSDGVISEHITVADPRWDIVVSSLVHAIDECMPKAHQQ